MLLKVHKHFAIATAALAIALSCPSARATNIRVAVTPTAANAIADVVSDFILANPTYTVTLISQSDSISNDAIVAGGSGYDLLLAQSALVPVVLKLRYPSLLAGDPFPYAVDTLVLYSTTVDISNGAPLTLAPFAVPDPSTLDPYGLATVEVLRLRYLAASRKGLPILTSDSGSSYASVEYLGTTYGFTGKSQICTAVTGVEEFEPGSFHHEYVFARDYFTPIVLAGVKLANTRDATQETELIDFVNFLAAAGGTTLQQHCYKLPGAATSLALPK